MIQADSMIQASAISRRASGNRSAWHANPIHRNHPDSFCKTRHEPASMVSRVFISEILSRRKILSMV